MFYNIIRSRVRGLLGLVSCAALFSFGYALLEYYVIRDTTFGLQPILFSLIYPYHLLMAAIFGVAGYLFLRFHLGRPSLLPGIILTGALFSAMLVVEDFMWFSLRAAAPVEGDLNGGKLIMHGEWSTQFLGSVNAHATEVPNWYFMNILFTLGVILTTRSKPKIAETVAPTP